MAVRARRKPLYRLEEVSQRWNLSIWDIAAYAVAREIAISFVATGLLAEEGIIDHTPDGAPQHIRQGERLLSGPVDLHGDDVWTIVQRGTHRCSVCRRARGVSRIAPRRAVKRILSRSPPGIGGAPCGTRTVRGGAVATLSGDEPVPSTVVVLAPRPRGAQPTHDWEACWVEICRTLISMACPRTRRGLVRRLQDWFDAEGRRSR